SFKDFSLDTILQLASSAVDLIRNSNFKLFNEPIPILGKSVHELLDTASDLTQKLTSAFDNVGDQIKNLKTELLRLLNGVDPTNFNVMDGVKKVIAQPLFLNSLPDGVRNKVLVAVEALQEGILSLPDTIASALSFKAPAKLVSALAAARDAIQSIPAA